MTKGQPSGLYDPQFEHDACGVGFIAHLKGRKSHRLVDDALHMLKRMNHRGACGCEENTGDGAGILIQMPHEFFYDECLKLGFKLPSFGKYGVAVVFFPRNDKVREECKETLERKLEELGMKLLGYRALPTMNEDLGSMALEGEPVMEQLFIQSPDDISDPEAFERKLFVWRKHSTHIIRDAIPRAEDFYIATSSYKTIVYKGQLLTEQVAPYFPDLQDKRVVSALAVVHSRFSTNTFPSWKLAQPFRYIAHNGEINTLKGNLNWLRAGEATFESSVFSKEELNMILPVCDPTNSDSASLDNVVELLTLAGRPLAQVMMMLIPEAWSGNEEMDDAKKAFYEFHAALMEPWDGPASITFTDGKIIGATLDRNGLRPSRYLVTNDDYVVMASESGVLDIDPSKVIFKGRLQPGKMFVADLEQGRIISDDELKKDICGRKPYREWINKYKIRLRDLPAARRTYLPLLDNEVILKRQQSFGYTTEDLKMILGPMAGAGKEPVGSMGIDTPLAALSHQSQHLANYFKQLFAQVTNPPIDSIRERMVMSLVTYVGSQLNILEEEPKQAHVVSLRQPVLTNKGLEKLRYIDHANFQTRTIPIVFHADGKPGSLERALNRVCRYAAEVIEEGYEFILLSDRSIDSDHAPIPSLLAVSAVHHHLIRKGLRAKIGLVVEAGDVWETHHFATLIGYGASAINPYLALETISSMKRSGAIQTPLSEEELHQNYIKAVGDGLLKVMSKMGISTLQSYNGAQIFEAVGLNKQLIDKYFTGTASRIGGLGLDDIAREILVRHKLAFPDAPVANPKLETGGVYQWKRRGEFHLMNPESIHLLQLSTRTGNYQIFKKYTRVVNDQEKRACTLRSRLRIKPGTPVPLEEVEPVESILTRFATGAMSFGSISHEAHSTLAIAMNRIGAKSNSGEGGEDEIRFERKPNGDWERSAIKQVASGRFGVTSYYLTNANELQIKMAQGAKPGEGGQLPGHKVDEWIGRVRHSTPGVGLISPPPHHDIYSIEDLAQLIFDLKNANREARINVKLVSEAGVGTIAAGVAKAKADVILISGHDGGTGASPISSIRHAGMPWELGLAETHQTLVKNNLRSRVTLQTDGLIRTGRDLAIATLLGAEEWGIATAALIVEGCIMMRKCHLNTCPVGIATQDPELRKRFTGDPQHVVNFFTYLATELREIMAELGFRTINEMVGQVDRLEARDNSSAHWKYRNLDLSAILYKEPASESVGLYKQIPQDHGLKEVLDWTLIERAKPALERAEPVRDEFLIHNYDRTVGAMLSNEISKIYKGPGLPDDTIHFKFRGSAGQSFGAFVTRGLTLELEGDANDYFGKGLCGGRLLLYPDRSAPFKAEENIIVGNVAFYGATSGEAYIRGLAGERFCVRNSGATVVVEGTGDHGCEYMTGGVAVILGETGRNFAAGMSGGIAYVFDPGKKFGSRCNMDMIELEPLDKTDIDLLQQLIGNHREYTGSEVAASILADWKNQLNSFVKVMPTEYKAALERKMKQEAASQAKKEEVING